MSQYHHSCISFLLLLAGLVLAPSGFGQFTTLMSKSSSGEQSDGFSSTDSAISRDGRYIVFQSDGNNLDPRDSDGQQDIFLHDRLARTTSVVSLSSSGDVGRYASTQPDISSDGSFVSFTSLADDLVPGDNNGALDIFVRDLLAGTTTRVSVNSGGTEGDAGSLNSVVSADGMVIAFESAATNLVAGDTNFFLDIFVHDRRTGVTTRVSEDSDGNQASRSSFGPSISDDGRYVVYSTTAVLAPDDTNGVSDVYLHDNLTATTTRVSLDHNGDPSTSAIDSGTISPCGSWVAFSAYGQLVPEDTNWRRDIYVRNHLTGEIDLVSTSSSGAVSNHHSYWCAVSDDGLQVAFESAASNLVEGDTNGKSDIFHRDRVTGTTRRVSVSTLGNQADNHCQYPAISSDGRFVSFHSDARTLIPGDINYWMDVFVHGPQLTLEARPDTVYAGDLVTFTAYEGEVGEVVLMFIVAVNDIPTLVFVAIGSFAADGTWSFGGTVPPGLDGLDVTFWSIGSGILSSFVTSNWEVVMFR